MEALRQDLRYALRSLRRSPGFTAVAVLTLALGIGANTAVFSVVNGILLESLPYQEPDRVVRVLEYHRERGLERGTTSLPNALDLRARSDAFAGLAVYDEWQPTLTGAGKPERLEGAGVSASYFDVLGVQPFRGRFFLSAEDEPGAAASVVLSHGFWTRRFGGDPGVVGDALSLNGTPYTVVGIAPPEFEDPQLSGASFGDPVLWRVYPGSYPEAPRDGRSLTAVARLRPGVTVEAAQAEADVVMAGLQAGYPDANAGQAFLLVPLKEQITAPVRQPLLIFLGAVGFVLLIACANVASLLLARVSKRSREIAVRSALGASRGRLVRQLLSESVVLALLGGAVGVGLAFWATDLILGLGAVGLPRAAEIGVDARVVAFAFGATLVTAILFGLAPALHAAAGRPRAALGDGGRGGTEGAVRRRAFRALVAAEVALSLVLLMGAGLLGRSFWRLQQVDPGLQTANVLTLELDPPSEPYGDDPAALSALYAALEDRLGALPGVEAVGAVNILPLSGSFNGFGFRRADLPVPAPGEWPSGEARSVTPGYLAAIGVPVIRGRVVRESDRADAPPVVVINQTMAERYWPGEDPVGQRIIVLDEPHEVVGIVGDVRQFSLREPPQPTMYLPQEQAPGWMRRDMKLALRTAGDPAALAPAVRAAVREIDAAIPISGVRTMEGLVSATLAEPRFRAALLGLFSLVALLLGAAGIYGIVSYGVARRTQELGIRAALGARPGELVRMVVRDGMTPVVAGLAVGTVAALLFGRVMAGLLYGVSASDPLTLAGVAAVLLAAALLASFVPARRASRVDAMIALRAE